MKTVTVQSPATIANLVCGFDILGLALQEPYDTMTLTALDEPVIRIVHLDDLGLPLQPHRNVAGVVLQKIMDATGVGFSLEVRKGIRPGSGIGSSAASAAGAAVAANLLLENRFSREELVGFAMEGEYLASGCRHADNIAPAIYGGICLVRSTAPLDIIPLPVPTVHVSVVHPHVEVRTADARQVLKKEVLLATAIRQWGNVGALVSGIYRNDLPLIGRALEDGIIEPTRRLLIPGFTELRQRCMDAGAIGGGISGSGPSVFMLSGSANDAEGIAAVMADVYAALSIPCDVYHTTIAETGVRINTDQLFTV